MPVQFNVKLPCQTESKAHFLLFRTRDDIPTVVTLWRYINLSYITLVYECWMNGWRKSPAHCDLAQFLDEKWICHTVENKQKIHKIDTRSYQIGQCEEIIAPTTNTKVNWDSTMLKPEEIEH